MVSSLRNKYWIARPGTYCEQQIVIDPGIGFGKRRIDNLRLLANLERFAERGYPVLLGISSKRFMGATLQNPDKAACHSHSNNNWLLQ